MGKSKIMEDITRIRKGYKPVSHAWYYQILYNVCALTSVIMMFVKRMINGTGKKHLRYKCPKCGKGSDDSQVVFNCIYDHEYNKDNNTK